MTTQQLQSSSAVVQIMHNVSDSTQQSRVVTGEASRNMERLARLAEQLLASVEAFKLREDANYFAPNSTMHNEGQGNQMTISGVFRTITATARPAAPGMHNISEPGFIPPLVSPAMADKGSNGPNEATPTHGLPPPMPSQQNKLLRIPSRPTKPEQP